MSERPEGKRDLAQLFEEGTAIDRALRMGVRDALILHKKLGFPVVVWEDGKVVWIPPEEIEIPAEE